MITTYIYIYIYILCIHTCVCHVAGLDADVDKILEVACIITDEDLNIIEEVRFAI